MWGTPVMVVLLFPYETRNGIPHVLLSYKLDSKYRSTHAYLFYSCTSNAQEGKHIINKRRAFINEALL